MIRTRPPQEQTPAKRPAPTAPVTQPSHVLALQRTAGNQAVTRMLAVARDTGAEGASGADPQAAQEPGAIVQLYMDNAPTPFSRKLIEHYAYADGAQYDWGVEDMRAVGDVKIDVFYFPKIEAAARTLTESLRTKASGEETASEPATVSVSDRSVFAAINNSVGGFTVEVAGTVTGAATPDGQEPDLVFEGTMRWSDTWDFDTRWENRIKGLLGMAGAKEDTRTLSGEIKTTIASLTLPGKPFKLTTADHPVRQQRYHPLEWAGG